MERGGSAFFRGAHCRIFPAVPQREVDGRIRFPRTAREVRDVDGIGTVRYGPVAQRRQTAPECRVVNVHVRRESVLQAVHVPPILDEIHPAVTSEFLGKLADVTVKFRREFLFQFLHFLVGDRFVVSDRDLRDRVLLREGIRPGKKMHARVRTTDACVVPKTDRLSVDRAHDGGVSAAVRFPRELPEVGIAGLLCHFTECFSHDEIVRFDRGKVIDSVSREDPHRFGDRAETVRRVGVPLDELQPVLIIWRRFRRERRHRFASRDVPRPSAVAVRAFSVNDLAEETFLRHLNGHGLKEIVNAVFEDQAVLPRLFRRVDQAQAVGERLCGWDLHRGVLPGKHGVDGHFRVAERWGSDVDQIQIVPSAKVFPRLLRREILRGRRESETFQIVLCPADGVLIAVGDRTDLHPFHLRETPKGRISAISQPNVPYAQRETRRSLKIVHIEDLRSAFPLNVRFLNVFVQLLGTRISSQRERHPKGGDFHEISAFHRISFLSKNKRI